MRTAVSEENAATTARDISTLTWLLSLVHGDADAAARIRALGDRIDRIHAEAATTADDTRLGELHDEERHVRADLRHTAGLP